MRYRRLFIQGASYFFTLNLADRSSGLLLNEITKLKNAFNSVKENHPFKINAMVVLPDHLHMIMTLPDDDFNFPTRLSLIKSYFSRQIKSNEDISLSRNKKRERGIWQRRFWEHWLRNEKDYAMHVDYIHNNPVKHGYVTNPYDWKYSTIHRKVW